MKTENVSFQSEGLKISAVLHLPAQANPSCIVASHGLLSSKDSDKYVALGERLSQEGMALLRFDFRGCGESDGTLEQSTVTARISDLSSAIQFVGSHPDLKNRIGLLGSSLGGYVSLITAATAKKVDAVVLWSTPFHLDGIESKKDAEGMPPLGKIFMRDLKKHRLLLLLPRVSHCLVIHGEADELVPVDQAWEIFHHLGPNKEIHIIEEGDHRLTDPGHRQRATDISVAWFKRFL
jgi:dipeptidyl aminopeptidase/acylaminoacyl peptidase